VRQGLALRDGASRGDGLPVADHAAPPEVEALAGIGSWRLVVADGRPSFSPGIWRLLGREGAPGDLRRESLLRLVYREDRRAVREALGRAGREPGTHEVEFRLRRGDDVRVLLARMETVDTARGLVVTGTLLDTTDLRRAAALASGQQRLLELVAADAPLADVLSALAAFIESEADDTRCAVMTVDEDGAVLRPVAAPSLPAAFVEATRRVPVGPRAGSCGTAAYRRERVIATCIAKDPLWADWADLAAAHGLRACWSTPVLDGAGALLGTFAMYPSRCRAPSAWELELAAAATNVARIAMTRERTTARLRKSDGLLRAIMESTPDVIIVRDVEGRCVAASATAGDLVAGTPEDVVGRTLAELPFSEERKDAIARGYEESMRTGKLVSVEQPVVVGTRERILQASIAPLRGPDGLLGAVGIGRDVTEQVLAERALRAEQRRLQLLLAQVPGAIWTTDAALRIVSADGGAFLPGEVGRLLGSSVRERARARPELAPVLAAHRRALAGESVECEVRVSRDRAFSTRVEPLRDAEGAVTGVIGVSVDVSERHAAQRRQRQLLRRIVTAQEEERRRISRELHDHLGQYIATLAVGTAALERDVRGDGVRRRLAGLRSLCADMGKSLHDLALELRPTALDDFGLRAAVASLVSSWSEHAGIRAELLCDGLADERLAPDVETTAYRVVQEALTNVARHAGASRVAVVLVRRADQLCAVVDDDGAGFDTRAAGVGRRLGLLGMRERALAVGGALDLASAPGAGTAVMLRVPLAGAARA
jgi:PAS domain S-box-containing protein